MEPHRRPNGAIAAALLLVVALAACARGSRQATTDPSTAPDEAAGIAPAVTPSATMQDLSLRTHDGRERTYHLYVPTSLPADRPAPLLIALHGGMGSGTQYATNSGFAGLAEANRFLVAFPDGIGAGPGGDTLRTWNGGACCGSAVKQRVDDVAFISMLIDTIERDHRVDPARVFAAGHSNGGVMAYRLACELADKIAAIGVQSTSLELEGCRPSRPVSLLHIHGTADENIPIGGGVGPNGVSGVDFNPPLDGVRAIAAADGCRERSTTATAADNADVTTERWPGCRDGTAVELVRVAGAGHAWMGSPAPPTRLLGEVYLQYDSSAAIWTFLVAHPRP